jgi:hypothetical protein
MQQLQVKGSTFGMVLRAARLGYHISDKHRAFVRISDVDERTLNITLAPLAAHVPKQGGNKMHYCWWEQKDDGEPPLLDLIPSIRAVRRVKKVISFDIDREPGERIWR